MAKAPSRDIVCCTLLQRDFQDVISSFTFDFSQFCNDFIKCCLGFRVSMHSFGTTAQANRTSWSLASLHTANSRVWTKRFFVKVPSTATNFLICLKAFRAAPGAMNTELKRRSLDPLIAWVLILTTVMGSAS
ncbi:hypothetical protein PsorP6_003212 [Peronosclerospora sorghi]|uniref:Uncharacterized protein n=1 Tax=Peronosclerospora sorghi TaxID=230839 RepID=A0ACC0VL39_9STRA|nr:hypothetical protein PsorP6_003212 [Peronosclerospora sorghi]